jgi:hypothetical protein
LYFQLSVFGLGLRNEVFDFNLLRVPVWQASGAEGRFWQIFGDLLLIPECHRAEQVSSLFKSRPNAAVGIIGPPRVFHFQSETNG